MGKNVDILLWQYTIMENSGFKRSDVSECLSSERCPFAGSRDLPRTCPVCVLDRQFSENLHFGKSKIFMKNFRLKMTFWG